MRPGPRQVKAAAGKARVGIIHDLIVQNLLYFNGAHRMAVTFHFEHASQLMLINNVGPDIQPDTRSIREQRAGSDEVRQNCSDPESITQDNRTA